MMPQVKKRKGTMLCVFPAGNVFRWRTNNIPIRRKLMADKPDAQQPQPIKINTVDEISRGRYSNMVIVSHSPDEFMLDWLLNSPNGPHLVARLILNPANVKRTIEILKLSLQQYEKEFGEVKVTESDNQKVH